MVIPSNWDNSSYISSFPLNDYLVAERTISTNTYTSWIAGTSIQVPAKSILVFVANASSPDGSQYAGLINDDGSSPNILSSVNANSYYSSSLFTGSTANFCYCDVYWYNNASIMIYPNTTTSAQTIMLPGYGTKDGAFDPATMTSRNVWPFSRGTDNWNGLAVVYEYA
jgi:hypothetical protein